MAQNFGSPITDKTKEARETLRLALGLGADVPFADYINHIPSQWTPAEIFKDGQKGFWYEPSDISTLFQDAAGLIPAVKNNDPVGLVKDKSGNGIDAVQSISARRMVYKESPPRLFLDKVDDELIVSIPTGGWVGTMTVATKDGTASYEVSIPSGNYLLGSRYFPSDSIVGVLFKQGGLTSNEQALVEKYFVSKGAVESFINTANISKGWFDWRILTSFPAIQTSEVKNIAQSWLRCETLTSFPLLDMSSINMGVVQTWFYCSSLVNFPANMFDNIKTGNFTGAFSGTNLSQESIDGILTSLVTSGIVSGTCRFDQSGGSAPSAIGNTAIDTLRSRGWTVNVTGGY